MITERDRRILKHLEKYKYATIEQLEKIFFKEQQYSYVIATRRMREMKNYIKVHRDADSNRNIYIWKEKISPPSRHRIILLDVLAEIIYQGYNVERFDIERQWMGGKVRSDGFVIFTINDRRYHFFVEVHISNNPCDLQKYDTLYNSNEVQRFLNKDFFPRVLLISDTDYHKDLKHARVVQLNTKLDRFSTVLL